MCWKDGKMALLRHNLGFLKSNMEYSRLLFDFSAFEDWTSWSELFKADFGWFTISETWHGDLFSGKTM